MDEWFTKEAFLMVLKCPKCGKNTVTLVSFKIRRKWAGSANTQHGTLKCSKCNYSEVFGGAY